MAAQPPLAVEASNNPLGRRATLRLLLGTIAFYMTVREYLAT